MQALRAQINPHLIYNTLNAIKWRALISEEMNIAESISLLSDFLEPVFKNQDLLCTVRDEINYVENYIQILNLLKTGGYSLELDIPEVYYEYRIIRFLLQPVVENSIIHGLERSSSGQIDISVTVEAGDMIISVADNGVGMSEERLQEVRRKIRKGECENGEGIGIVNVDRRIKNQYGDAYGLDIRNGEEKGAVVSLKMKAER